MYTWSAEQIERLKSGKVATVYGIIAEHAKAVTARGSSLAWANRSPITNPRYLADPTANGGGAVHGIGYNKLVVAAALAHVDPRTMVDRVPEAPPAPPAPKAVQLTTESPAADGLHQERAKRIQEFVKELQSRLHASVHPQLAALTGVVEKQCAQRYEYILEQRVKDAVAQALADERKRVAVDFEQRADARAKEIFAKERQEYLDEYGGRMANMKASFEASMDSIVDHAQNAKRMLSGHRDWRQVQHVVPAQPARAAVTTGRTQMRIKVGDSVPVLVGGDRTLLCEVVEIDPTDSEFPLRAQIPGYSAPWWVAVDEDTGKYTVD